MNAEASLEESELLANMDCETDKTPASEEPASYTKSNEEIEASEDCQNENLDATEESLLEDSLLEESLLEESELQQDLDNLEKMDSTKVSERDLASTSRNMDDESSYKTLEDTRLTSTNLEALDKSDSALESHSSTLNVKSAESNNSRVTSEDTPSMTANADLTSGDNRADLPCESKVDVLDSMDTQGDAAPETTIDETTSKTQNTPISVKDTEPANAKHKKASADGMLVKAKDDSIDANKSLTKSLNKEAVTTDPSEAPCPLKIADVEKSHLSDMETDPNIPDKDGVSEKNITEPENTEFVQISQDKHDDSQMESQSIDAEDPFGGDNLPSENVESMETEDCFEASDANFQKLGDQADNLQDVVNAKENFQDKFANSSGVDTGKGCEPSVNISEKETPAEGSVLTSKTATNLLDTASNSAPKESDKESATSLDDKSQKEKSKSMDVNEGTRTEPSVGEKKGEDVATMEAEVEQSDVLPGQDDELCIIPDSMKVILPREATKKSDDKSKTPDVSGKNGKEDESKKDDANEVSKDTEKTSTDPKESASVENKSDDKEKSDSAKDVSSEGKTLATTTDVIDVDEEGKNSEVEEITTTEKCKQCNQERSCKIKVKIGSECYNVCSKLCKLAFKSANNKAMDIPSDGVNSKREKRCANCLLIVEQTDERNLSWETMEFCNEECLGKFQTKYGSYCRNCNGSVQAVSLGKYCVRFGYDVRQFCCSTCLEEFKKGLKVCSYCQKDISSGVEGFLAPVGEKGQFKDFCTQDCMEKYTRMSSTDPPSTEKKACGVCQEEKIVHCEVRINRDTSVAICSDPCFAAFKFVNKVDPEQCSTCKIFFEVTNKKSFVVFYENDAHIFCSKTCLNVFIITNRKIVPCNWCKVKKYNFDMIKKELRTGQVMMMCSLNCLTLYQVSINAVSARRINCDFCKEFSQAQYHLTMSDATIRNFCSYNCVMKFQGLYTKSPITIPTGDDPVPTGIPKKTNCIPQRTIMTTAQKASDMQSKKSMPVISSVTSLATMGNGQASPNSQQNAVNNVGISSNVAVQSQTPQVIYKQQVITRPPTPVKQNNKTTQCKPVMHTKGVSVRPHPCTKSTQTDEIRQMVVPIPTPIFVPFPMHMYSMPFPVPLPFPLPIPVPIFIPTTRNSAKGIFKDIKRIQEKIPADPFEAELLMMAEMVATEKKGNESDSDSGDDNRDGGDEHGNANTGGFSPEGVDSSNTFGDDMLQMALKMATGELDEPAVDLEAALTPNTITATQAPPQPDATLDNDVQPERLISSRGRKRVVPYKPRSTPSKRGRRVSGSTNEMPMMPPPEPHPPPQARIMEPIEKPDANMALKYTFGVNAWRQWVITKNTELEKQNIPTRKIKLFKTDLLQLTADELNYSLCLFVKEVRKPNGAEYAPDTIYYLCLGIQQYLFENNRIDNIFTDSYYEKFTDCLNEVAKRFSVIYNDAQYIVTRVEEEHLWECKQLGAHSPHVLLSTLMFFNTKHFNLVTVEEHMQLSFSHIMKHWKRNPAAQPAAVAGKVPGSRNVLLRFYPPQSALEANSRKKKVYEQQENEENPLRCPVKLYEFYLSKCPESVKTRNDVFYLLPERSCVPDSPVWYSTSPLAKDHLVKMLYRVKMVKEINVALLTS